MVVLAQRRIKFVKPHPTQTPHLSSPRQHVCKTHLDQARGIVAYECTCLPSMLKLSPIGLWLFHSKCHCYIRLICDL